MRKRFILASLDLQAVLHETTDRKSLPAGMFPETNNMETEPVATMYNPDRYVLPEDVPECCDDYEKKFFEMMDEKFALDNERGEILPFVGTEPRLRLPGRVVKTVKRVLHPQRKTPVAACFSAATGLLIFVY